LPGIEEAKDELEEIRELSQGYRDYRHAAALSH